MFPDETGADQSTLVGGWEPRNLCEAVAGKERVRIGRVPLHAVVVRIREPV